MKRVNLFLIEEKVKMKKSYEIAQDWHKENCTPESVEDGRVTIKGILGKWEVRAEGFRYYMPVNSYYCIHRESQEDTMGFELMVRHDKEQTKYHVQYYFKGLDIFGLGTYGGNSEDFKSLEEVAKWIDAKIEERLDKASKMVSISQKSSRTYSLGFKYKVQPKAVGVFGGGRYFESYQDIEEFYSNISHGGNEIELLVSEATGAEDFLCYMYAIKNPATGNFEIKYKEEKVTEPILSKSAVDTAEELIGKILDHVHTPEGVGYCYDLSKLLDKTFKGDN